MDTIDAALHELGMLGSVTDARLQYLQEISKCSRIIQTNSRYVTNVSCGFRIKPACDYNRVKPYTVRNKNREDRLSVTAGGYREERPRTRSENADAPPVAGITIAPFIVETVVDMAIDLSKKASTSVDKKRIGLKKSKSLENVRIENDNASQPSHEMEFVSSRIQRLKMND